MNITNSSKAFWQTTFVFTFLVNLVILIWSISRWIELKVILWRSVWIMPLLLYLAVLGGCALLFLKIRRGGGSERLTTALEFDSLQSIHWRLAGGLAFVAVLLAIPYIKFAFQVGEVVKKSTQDPVLTTIVFYWVVWWLILLAAAGLKMAFRSTWAGGFATALIALGLAYELFSRLKAISSYPFSLSWSEASRYYYASLYFAQWVYGKSVPLSTLHPTRYLLQSLPFLIPGLGLVASRIWQVLLWIVLTLVAAFALVRRLGWMGKPLGWLVAGWCALLLFRVGVYYHLEVMVIVPLLFVSARHPRQSLAALIFASVWAGVSRINWFPVPAMLGVTIYLLEEPFSDYTGVRQYLTLPALWSFAGLVSALIAQALYIPLSGNANNLAAFASSLTSDQLWYRLWPNDSFPLGVLPAVLIVSGPLLIIIVQAMRGRFFQLHPLRWIGLFAMLLVLFVGGLIVSVKIGGGGDLHNMDAYSVLVMLIAAYFASGKVLPENGEAAWGSVAWPVIAVALVIPLVFLIPALAPFSGYNEPADRAVFEQLKTLAEQAARRGPVLFLDERELLTFHQINVPLVPEYESVTLMEMAMSNNQPYLQQFYSDLKSHRFAAIIAGKQNVGFKEEGAFSDENNIWNSRVSPYILCYYQATVELDADEGKLEYFTPRLTPGTCP